MVDVLNSSSDIAFSMMFSGSSLCSDQLLAQLGDHFRVADEASSLTFGFVFAVIVPTLHMLAHAIRGETYGIESQIPMKTLVAPSEVSGCLGQMC